MMPLQTASTPTQADVDTARAQEDAPADDASDAHAAPVETAVGSVESSAPPAARGVTGDADPIDATGTDAGTAAHDAPVTADVLTSAQPPGTTAAQQPELTSATGEADTIAAPAFAAPAPNDGASDPDAQTPSPQGGPTIVGGAAVGMAQAQWHPDSLPQRMSRRPRKRFWVIVGAAALAVIAAVIAIVLVVTSAVPPRIEGLALLRDLPTKPVIGAWELEHPLSGEVPAGDEIYLNGYTAGPSTALLVWSTDRPLAAADVSDAPGETRISLVNTANGHTLWERRVTELSDEFDRFDAPVVVSPPDAAAIVLSQGDLMVSVSRRDGRVVSTSSEHSSVEGIGFADFAAPAAFVPGLDGDLLISSTIDGTGTVGRYRSTDLTDPIWEVSGDAGERATTAGDKLFFDDSVYSLEDGAEIPWEGELTWYYQQLGRDLVAIDYSGNDTTIRGVDGSTGAERWTVTSALPVVLDASGLLVVADQSGQHVRRLDPRTGDVEWTSQLTSTWDGTYTVGDTIMLGDGAGGYTGISARTGEVRYEEGDAAGSLVGYSERTLLLTLDGKLVGIDATTGERSWSVPEAGDAYGFAAWGGSAVALASVLPAGSTEPAVLSVSDPSDR
ncbi:PQQ-like beta-propeller repeat protein [Plantibacter flavus]|uniref:outer membrane protein assembly factor BamB family protein n=1 Tax=Plantibacter flavus TaxID=150123 RepID=UPI003F191044